MDNQFAVAPAPCHHTRLVTLATPAIGGSRLSRPRHRALAPAVLLLLTLVGCSADAPEPSAETPAETPASPSSTSTSSVAAAPSAAPGGDLYVALGDSFTAAPLVPETDPSEACLRSDANYPRLVAAELGGTRLVDVSCVGATSESMTRPQRIGSSTAPPQLDALTDDVDLVTLGVGGNDFNLFTSLLGDCLRLGLEDAPTSCRDRNSGPDGDLLVEVVRQIEARVTAVVTEVRERAPEARVVVVTYPRLLPNAGSCPELIRGPRGVVRRRSGAGEAKNTVG